MPRVWEISRAPGPFSGRVQFEHCLESPLGDLLAPNSQDQGTILGWRDPSQDRFDERTPITPAHPREHCAEPPVPGLLWLHVAAAFC